MPKRTMPMLRFVESPAEGGSGEPEGGKSGDQPQTFTQDDVNRLVGQARTDERRKVQSKYADYDQLKAQAGQSKTLEDRLAEVEKRAADAITSALRSDIAARHGISAEDRDLFLTGADEETLTAQAKRLTEREADRKKRGNVAPKEGGSADHGSHQGDDGIREFARSLFGRSDD